MEEKMFVKLTEFVQSYMEKLDKNENFCWEDVRDAIRTGAEWMAGQGETHELTVESPVLGPPMICCPVHADNGDEVVVQIRKK